MDTYQGEWGHCDNKYCLSLVFSLLLLGPLMAWPTQLFPLHIGSFNFLFSLFESQPTINLFSKLELGPWNQSVEQPIMYK